MSFFRDELSCFDQLRMDKSTFHKLCDLLKNHGGLKVSRNIFVEQRVAIFLNILGHDQNQRLIVRCLRRSKDNYWELLTNTEVCFAIAQHPIENS